MLVVDDDEMLLRAYKTCFGRNRAVVVATDGKTATRLAREQPVDLAIVDLQLRGECGIELITSLKQLQPKMQAVLITGYGCMDVAVRGLRAGADEVLAKPITYSEIMARLDGDLRTAKEPAVTPSLARAQWEHVHRVLHDSNGNVSLAARRLGIYRSTLQRWLRRNAPRS